MKVVAFVPLKINSERLAGKNFLDFAGSGPLYHRVLRTLVSTSLIDEVFVFCSAPSLQDLPTGVTYRRRPENLDSPDTPIMDVIASFGDEVTADVYVLAHATAPFLQRQTIENLVRAVAGLDHDSAFAVVAEQDFFWNEKGPLNFDPADIPRSQDLAPIYRETTGVYVFTRDVLLSGKRVGLNPFLFEVDKIEALDINDGQDWLIAEAVALRGTWSG